MGNINTTPLARVGIRGIRQTIASGYLIGRSSPGNTKGPPQLIPLPPANQQAIIAGAGGKAISAGGTSGAGTIASGASSTVMAGTGINVTGGPNYTVSLQVPVTIAHGGTNATTAGTALDNIGPFSTNGILSRTGPGAYTVLTDPLPVAHGGTGSASAGTALDNIGPFGSNGYLRRSGAGTYTVDAIGQLKGTTTNDNAAAGDVGEFINSQVLSGSPVTLTNNVAANLTSISLTAGDWDIFGNVTFTPSGGAAPTLLVSAMNTTSATFPDPAFQSAVALPSMVTITIASAITPIERLSLSATTTVYLVCLAAFPSGTVTACGVLRARRVR